MFKKHQFTCPDVIYLIDRQKKINRAVLGSYAVIFGGMILGGKYLERKEIKELQKDAETLANKE